MDLKQKWALVPFPIRCYLSVIVTLLTSFCDKITSISTRMILERFCCISKPIHALSKANFQIIVQQASHTTHTFVMLVFPTLTTIFICHSHYIPMCFSYFTDVLDTTTIRNCISIYHPFSTDLHHFLHNNKQHFSHSLYGYGVVSRHLFSKFYSFHIHPHFVYSLDSKHFLYTNGTKEKQNLDLLPLQLPYLRLNPQIIFSQTTFICSIIFQPRSRYIYIFQECYCRVVLLVFNLFSCTPSSNLQHNMSPMHNTIVLVSRHAIHNLPMFSIHFLPCLGTSFPQHSYIFATLLSFSCVDLQSFLTHS